MTTPLVSIIVPTYNVEDYVEECIQSLLNQTYNEIEIIVLDDASTDNTVKLLEQYTDNITLIKNSVNKGQGTRRNEGMRIAQGDYLYFVDSDDWIELQTIEDTVEQALRTGADLVRFNGDFFYDGTEKLIKEGNYNFSHVLEDREVYQGKELLKKNRKSFSPSPCLYLIKKEVIQENNLSFLEGVLHEDEYFTTLLFCLVKKMTYLDQFFYHRRYRTNSTMTIETKDHQVKSFESYLLVYMSLKKKLRKTKLSLSQKKFVNRQLISLYAGLRRKLVSAEQREKMRTLGIDTPKNKIWLKLINSKHWISRKKFMNNSKKNPEQKT